MYLSYVKIDELIKPENINSKENAEMIFEHIFYEFYMFLNLGKLILFDMGNSVVNNSIHEAYRIHLRILDDFFNKPNPKYTTDVTIYSILSERVINQLRLFHLEKKSEDRYW